MRSSLEEIYCGSVLGRRGHNYLQRQGEGEKLWKITIPRALHTSTE